MAKHVKSFPQKSEYMSRVTQVKFFQIPIADYSSFVDINRSRFSAISQNHSLVIHLVHIGFNLVIERFQKLKVYFAFKTESVLEEALC